MFVNYQELKDISWLYLVKEFILKVLFEGAHFHLWFVYSILGLYLFVPILRKWVKSSTDNEILYFLILWFITLVSQINLLRPYIPQIDLINFSGYIGYFVLGYYLNRLDFKNKAFPLLLYILGFVVTFLGTYYLTSKKGIFVASFYKYLSPNVLIASIGVFLLVKNLSIRNLWLKRVITMIDNNSFGIYFSHVLFIYMFSYFGLDWSYIHPIVGIPLITLLVLVMSNMIISILKKNRYTRIISG